MSRVRASSILRARLLRTTRAARLNTARYAQDNRESACSILRAHGAQYCEHVWLNTASAHNSILRVLAVDRLPGACDSTLRVHAVDKLPRMWLNTAHACAISARDLVTLEGRATRASCAHEERPRETDGEERVTTHTTHCRDIRGLSGAALRPATEASLAHDAPRAILVPCWAAPAPR
jgi:hypothetical protein